MMEELCYHIIDIAQNSVAANSKNVYILLDDSTRADQIVIEVKDDGRGMDAQTMQNVQDPFYTTKSYKKVGLGIPLLKQAAQDCGGDFRMESEPGKGTLVFTSFQKSHIDTPPIGDLKNTIFTLIVSTEGANVDFTYATDLGRFNISIAQVKEQIGELHLTHPDVMKFLREYIEENVGKLTELIW